MHVCNLNILFSITKVTRDGPLVIWLNTCTWKIEVKCVLKLNHFPSTFFDFLFCFAQTSGGFRSFSVNDCCCTVQIHQPADKDNFSWQFNLRVFVAVSASIVWLLYLQWILCTSVEKIESGLLSWSSTWYLAELSFSIPTDVFNSVCNVSVKVV